MGLLSSFFGGIASRRFVTESAFEKNIANQTAMAPQTVEELRKYGVNDQTRLKLEFFFYTNSEPNAAKLAAALDRMGYAAEHGPSASDRKQFLVNGWTKKMAMNEKSVVAWTRRMCQLGFDCDCEFDGWGTNPQQD
jgi:regulator of RNase E activity RraB